MINKINRLILILFIIPISLFASDAAIKGVVVDGKGLPIIGIKVQSSQFIKENPDGSLETKDFEVKTNSKGEFYFNNLQPDTIYDFDTPLGTNWLSGFKEISTSTEGTVSILTTHVTFRFKRGKGAIIIDTKTGLMWTNQLYNIQKNSNQLNKNAKKLRDGGYKDWRMPTENELEEYQEAKINYTGSIIVATNNNQFFETSDFDTNTYPHKTMYQMDFVRFTETSNLNANQMTLSNISTYKIEIFESTNRIKE